MKKLTNMRARISAVLLPFALALCAENAAHAQNQEEESAFVMCKNMSGTQGEAQACTDWIVQSVCRATYRTRAPEIEKYLSLNDFQQYRLDAEKNLPRDCEAMMAVELNLDILSQIRDPAQRTARWERIMTWAERLEPNQARDVAYALSSDSDFPALLKRSKIRAFVEKCRNEASTFLPEVKTETSFFLYNLEKVDPAAMTPVAGAVLLLYELEQRDYLAVRDRIPRIAFDGLPDSLQKRTLSKIAAELLPVFGIPRADPAGCIPEAGLRGGATLRLLEMLKSHTKDALLQILIIHNKLAICDEDGAALALSGYYASAYASADVADSAKQLMSYAEASRNEKLVRALAIRLAEMPQAAIDVFKSRYGKKLAELALTQARNDLAANRAGLALGMLDGLARIVPQAAYHEVLLELGRARSMTKNESLARQLWGTVIGESPNTPLSEKAYYLTILSLRREKKTAEAEAMRKQFSELVPASRFHALL